MCGSKTAIDYKQLYNQLAQDTLSHGLDNAWKNMEADDSLRAREVAKLIYMLHPKSVLEVAAGYGFVTHAIREYNPNVSMTCLEIATPFCDILRNRGYNVIEENFITAQLEDKWDVVTIMQVLEHLESQEILRDVLVRVSSWAERYLIVEIPEGGPIDGERHILSLTDYRMEEILESIGLDVVFSKKIPPQGGQITNGYTAMVQIVGMKGGCNG